MYFVKQIVNESIGDAGTQTEALRQALKDGVGEEMRGSSGREGDSKGSLG